MAIADPTKLTLRVGSEGWTIEDLDDPLIEGLWEWDRFEIADGVLVAKPGNSFDAGRAVVILGTQVRIWLDENRLEGGISVGADFVPNPRRVCRASLMYLTAAQERRQKRSSRERRKPGVRFGRVVVSPELIVESIDPRHATYTKETKHRWYAEAGVKNYWLLHAYERSLDCLVLDGDDYRVDQSGRGNAVLRPSAFPGLVIPLKSLWE